MDLCGLEKIMWVRCLVLWSVRILPLNHPCTSNAWYCVWHITSIQRMLSLRIINIFTSTVCHYVAIGYWSQQTWRCSCSARWADNVGQSSGLWTAEIPNLLILNQAYLEAWSSLIKCHFQFPPWIHNFKEVPIPLKAALSIFKILLNCSRETPIQFSSVTQSCLTLCNPVDSSTPGFPVHYQLPELSQTQVHQVSDAIQPSHPLISPSPSAFNLSQHQGLFQGVSSLYQVARVLEFQLQYQSFKWTLRTDLL